MAKSMRPSCPHRRQASSHTGSHFTARLLIANRKIRHMLQPLDQRRMVPITATEGGAGAEHLLGAGGVRQVDPQLLGPGQRQVQILLVQIDAKARIEGALDHAFAVYFKDLRRGKATHQRLTHLGRIGAVFAANSSASATAWMFSATMIWFATLAVWPSPLPPTRVMFLPMFWSNGSARSKVCGSPPTMMLKVPALAPTSPPDTGASRYCAPVWLILAANALVAVGEIELMSITTLFGDRPAATPSARNSTCGALPWCSDRNSW